MAKTIKYKFKRTNKICPEELFAGSLGANLIDFSSPKRIIDFSDSELIALVSEYPNLAGRYFEWYEVHEKEETTAKKRGESKRRKVKANERSKASSKRTAEKAKETEAPEDSGHTGEQ